MIYKKTKKMLKNALEDVADKGEITSSNLDILEKLICSIKNLCEIEDKERSSDENNSFDSRPSRTLTYPEWDERDMMRDSRDIRSNARRRDNMGRYTNDPEHDAELNEIISELHELKNRVSNPETKQRLNEIIKDFRA